MTDLPPPISFHKIVLVLHGSVSHISYNVWLLHVIQKLLPLEMKFYWEHNLFTTLSNLQTFLVRQIVITSMVCAWGVRLSTYLIYRMVRIDNDDRYEPRNSCVQFAGFWSFQVI